MRLLALPHLRHPQGVSVGGVGGDNVAEATGHCANAGEDSRQLVALAGYGLDLTDESVNALSPSMNWGQVSRWPGLWEPEEKSLLGTLLTSFLVLHTV